MARGKSKTASKKVTMKKAQKMVSKMHKTKAKKNLDTFFFKAKNAVTILPGQSISTANYVYNQFALMDSTASYGVTQNAEFQLYAKLYDKVRINSIKVRIIPKANVLDQSFAQADNAFNVSGSGVYYTVIDRDGIAPSNVAAMLRYPSVRKTSVLKPTTRTYSIKWPTGMWLDTANIYTETDTLRRQGCFGGVTLYGANFLEDQEELENEPWATAEIEYNCVFQGKTSASLTLAEDGSVCVTAHDTIANLDQTQLLPQYGGFTQKVTDNVGTIVTITDRGDQATA